MAIDKQTLLTLVESVLAIALHATIVFRILVGQRRNPSATLAWILAVIFIPFVGVALWLVIGRTRSLKLVTRTKRAAEKLRQARTAGPERCVVEPGPSATDEWRTTAMIALGNRLDAPAATRCNRTGLLVSGAATYREIFVAIAEAVRQVHVEFYIIQNDRWGLSLRDRLADRAANGIEVRLLYDAVGSSGLPRGFWDPLTESGGRVVCFNPVSAFTSGVRRRDRVDFRNHRKLVVVDGSIGFTGGINFGREYLGRDPEIGNWRDTHMRLEGPGVSSLQEVFAIDWLSASNERTNLEGWFPMPDGGDKDGSVVQIVDSGPNSAWSPVEQIYVQAISQAKSRLWLTTPYFIPSSAVECALVNAGLRGVDVRILVPEKTDSMLVGLASRSYFPELMRAGIRIFVYERGFIHAKTMAVDSWMGTVGSANMDMRSFRLNFELNAFVYDTEFSNDLANQFLVDLDHAREIDPASEGRIRTTRLLAQQTARLMSPLL